MTSLQSRADWRSLLLASILLLVPAYLAAQPEAIPLAELTAEQFGNLPDEQLIALDEGVTTLGELRAEEAARREAHTDTVAEQQQWAHTALDAHEAARAESEAIEAASQNLMVTEFMAFIAELAAANPEIVRRARAQAEVQRQASELRRRAYRASTERELRRIERELRRLIRQSRGG